MIGRRKLLQAAGVAGLMPLMSGNVGAEANMQMRGTGDLGIIIERATGSVQIIETTGHSMLARISGLGDLSHASAVFSRDARFVFIFGRDGGLSKIDLLGQKLVKRIIQAGNSIGGAISDDGQLVAVSNYKPGGVKIFHSADLSLVADIPARYDGDNLSKTVGLVDIPGNRFVYALYDAGETWLADCSGLANGAKPTITRFEDVGLQPYDGLVTENGRYYIAGLFGEDGMAMIDLWQKKPQVKRILNHYGRGEKKLPVYKMPHLEGWTQANGKFYFPAVGHHKVLIADDVSFAQTGAIDVHGQPVFVMARPDGRQVWVNFAHPLNDTVQVIDTMENRIIKQFKPGPAVLHMEFTPRGEQVWISVRDENRIDIYDTRSLEKIKSLPAKAPSGIFFTSRAGRIGL